MIGTKLFELISVICSRRERSCYSHASSTTVFLFWEIGNHINIDILKNKRADYGYTIELVTFYRNFVAKIPRCKTFLFERKEIADTQISDSSPIPLGTFKDPYLFDVLGIKDEYLEADVEAAILRELEKFILEFGKGFAFVGRQKRMIIDGRDHWLDLLFYNRDLKRLVAVELKYGRFEAAHNGQMKLYLGWLDKYERREGENAPIGLILCSENGREELEFLKLDRDLAETRERMAQRNLLTSNDAD